MNRASTPPPDPSKHKKQSSKRQSSIRPPRIFLYFDAVARYGSMRKAADTLRIASSALNRQILLLEEEVGVVLLERLPRGVRLTAAGELFANYVRDAISGLETVGEQIESLRGLIRGRVRLATVESAAGDFLPRVIAQFQKLHPGVEFTLTVGAPDSLAAELLNDSADLLITHNAVDHRDITIIAKAPQAFCALVAQGHPLASRKRLRLRDCAAYPIALADRSLAGRVLIENTLATASVQLQPALISNSVAAMKAYALLGQAICFQFAIGCKEGTFADMVAIPLIDDAFKTAELILAVRRERVLPIAAAAFLETLRGALAELATAT
jgi:DNA-binding transcriptional LysR family regulator